MRLLKVLTGILAISTGLLLASCGSGDNGAESKGGDSEGGKKTEITFLTMQLRPVFDDYFHERFAEFEKTHPDVKIVWQDLPYQNYATKLMTSFMTGSPPDVINLPSDSITDYIGPGYLMDLTTAMPTEVQDSFVPGLLDACKVQGTLYAYPWYASSAVTFVNRKLMEDAGLGDYTPQYYDELPELSRKVKEKTGKFVMFPLYTEAGTLRLFLMEAGIRLLNDDETKAIFNTPRAVEVLKFWTDLYRENLVPSEALTASHRRPIELYKTSQLALLVTGPQFLRQVKSDAPDVFASTDVAPLIHWKEKHQVIVALHSASVAAGTKNPELSREFAQFITNAESQLEFSKKTPILPSVQAALDDPYFSKADETLEGRARSYMANEMKQAIVYPVIPEQRKILKVFDELVEATALGKMSAQEAINKAEAEVNDILAKKK